MASTHNSEHALRKVPLIIITFFPDFLKKGYYYFCSIFFGKLQTVRGKKAEIKIAFPNFIYMTVALTDNKCLFFCDFVKFLINNQQNTGCFASNQ